MGQLLSKNPSTTVQRFNLKKDTPTYTTKNLSQWELDYLAKRHVHVKKSMENLIGLQLDPEQGVPIVSIAIGGRGGARSLPLILGVMQELEMRDFLNTVSYTAASGVGSCFLSMWHASQAKDMTELESYVRDVTCNRWLLEDIPKKDMKQIAFQLKKMERLQLPLTLLDIYAALLSWRIFGGNTKSIPLDRRMSDLDEQKLMRKYLTPYPIIDTLAVQKGIPEHIHSNHFEFAPFLSGIRSAQCFVDTRIFGMKIEEGKIVGGSRNFYVDVDGYKHACRQQESLGHIMAVSMSSYNDGRWCASVSSSLLKLKKLKKTSRVKHLLTHLADQETKRKEARGYIASPSPLDAQQKKYAPMPQQEAATGNNLQTPLDTTGAPVNESNASLLTLGSENSGKSLQSGKKGQKVHHKADLILNQLKSYNFAAHLWDIKDATNDGRDPSISKRSEEAQQYASKKLSSRRFLYLKEPTESLSLPIAPLIRSERVPRILVILDFSGSHDIVELKKAMAYAAFNNLPFPTIDLKKKNFKKAVQIFEPQQHDPPNSPSVVYFQCKTNVVFDKDFDPSSIPENIVSEEQFKQLMLWARFTTKEFYSKLVRLLKRGADAHVAGPQLAGGSFLQAEGPLFQNSETSSATSPSNRSNRSSSTHSGSFLLERASSSNRIHPEGRKSQEVASAMNRMQRSAHTSSRAEIRQRAILRKQNTQSQLARSKNIRDGSSSARSASTKTRRNPTSRSASSYRINISSS